MGPLPETVAGAAPGGFESDANSSRMRSSSLFSSVEDVLASFVSALRFINSSFSRASMRSASARESSVRACWSCRAASIAILDGGDSSLASE